MYTPTWLHQLDLCWLLQKSNIPICKHFATQKAEIKDIKWLLHLQRQFFIAKAFDGKSLSHDLERPRRQLLFLEALDLHRWTIVLNMLLPTVVCWCLQYVLPGPSHSTWDCRCNSQAHSSVLPTGSMSPSEHPETIHYHFKGNTLQSWVWSW